ncbi:hypothetical protein QAD02_010041 [Eretmocerus hayati]|uniref:Uncharacterized protein n=1 Tax=Eretmocerus hayati TaxID=131215 RepID=A0ACC2NB76_9HYME|nr:hypothetical protein QAD02_010041 [Eretmocerus hayati]
MVSITGRIRDLILYISVFLLAIVYLPGIPPYAKFTALSVTKPRKLETIPNLKVGGLDEAEILFEGKIKGPQSYASHDGKLYTGLENGYVVEIDERQVVPIAILGENCDPNKPYPQCARPFGMQFHRDGYLYVCDAYNGIFKLDVKTGKYERIVDGRDLIEGVPPKQFVALDIDNEGNIYWAHYSSEFNIDNVGCIVSADPSGRIIRYNATTKKNEVLVRDISAHGLSLSKNEDFIMISEMSTFRLTKYNIRGPKAGVYEPFIDGLPGSPDNIYPDGQGGYFVSLVRTHELSSFFLSHPNIRRVLARMIYILQLPVKFILALYPNDFAEWLLHYIGSLDSISPLLDRSAVVLRIDEEGHIIEGASNTNGKFFVLSSVCIHNGFLWLGSAITNFAARIPVEKVFPNLLLSDSMSSTLDGFGLC